MSKQDELGWHHVAALTNPYPRESQRQFNGTVVMYAGLRFGAHGFYHRGLGGIEPLYKKLENLQNESEVVQTDVQQQKRAITGAPQCTTAIRQTQPVLPAPDVAPASALHPVAACTTAEPSTSSPLKACLTDGGAALSRELQNSVPLLDDKTLSYDTKRQILTILQQANVCIERKVEERKRGQCNKPKTNRTFEDAKGFTYEANAVPHRMKSCTEHRPERRDTNKNKTKRDVPVDLVMEYGFESTLEKSGFQKAVDNRKVPHSCTERGLKLYCTAMFNSELSALLCCWFRTFPAW